MTLRQHLEIMVDMHKTMTHASIGGYICLEDYVVRNGVEFSSSPLTADEWKHLNAVAKKALKRRKDFPFDNGAIEADLKVSFANNDSFIAHTMLVYVRNGYDTCFYRYPTTFHDIYHNGDFHKAQDESWMNSAFAKQKEQK